MCPCQRDGADGQFSEKLLVGDSRQWELKKTQDPHLHQNQDQAAKLLALLGGPQSSPLPWDSAILATQVDGMTRTAPGVGGIISETVVSEVKIWGGRVAAPGRGEPKEGVWRGQEGEAPKTPGCFLRAGTLANGSLCVTCTVDGLVPLERTLTQGSDSGH